MSGKAEPLIVVGVDGSPHSQDALRWAAEQARLTGGTVHAVMSWDWPNAFSLAGLTLKPDPGSLTIEQATTEKLDETVAAVLGAEPSVPVRRRVLQGAPAKVLLEASESADLLVVGTRGHGGFKGALLGSVSQQVMEYAHCTVVVVRTGGEAAH